MLVVMKQDHGRQQNEVIELEFTRVQLDFNTPYHFGLQRNCKWVKNLPPLLCENPPMLERILCPLFLPLMKEVEHAACLDFERIPFTSRRRADIMQLKAEIYVRKAEGNSTWFPAKG